MEKMPELLKTLAVPVALFFLALAGEDGVRAQPRGEEYDMMTRAHDTLECLTLTDPQKAVQGCTRELEGLKRSAASNARPDAPRFYADAHVNRGRAYVRLGDYDRAASDFRDGIRYADEAIRRSVDRIIEMYETRVQAYAGLGDYDHALSDCAEIIRRDAGKPVAYYIRAESHMVKNDYDSAIADYAKMIQLSNSSESYAGRAWAYFRKGMLEQAKTDAGMAVRVDPQQPFSRTVRGYVNSALGAHETALADFSKAISFGWTTPLVLGGRGAVYAALGKKDLAMADLRQAIATPARRPDDREAQAEARERLAALELGASAPSAGVALPPPAAVASPPAPPAVVIAPTPQSAPVEKAVPAPLRRIALVIGNSAYRNAPALPNPSRDARSIAETFRHLGFSEVVELHDLSLSAFSSALKDFGDHAADADWAVLYFAGHGLEVGGQNYLVPVDAALARASHVEEEALPLDRVLTKVQPARKLKLVILDSCRNNPFAQRMTQEKGAMRSMARGFARVEPLGGVLVAYAARDGSVAADGSAEHSPFTQALLDHFEQPGLELSLMFRKVRDSVVQTTHGDQEPFTYGSLPGEAMYFSVSK
jgi:tetratricopeptide (TPR) repeat protein